MIFFLSLLISVMAQAAPFTAEGYFCYSPWMLPAEGRARKDADATAAKFCPGAVRISEFEMRAGGCPQRGVQIADFAKATYDCPEKN